MRAARLLVLLLLLPVAAAASESADDWKIIGGALSLVQRIVQLAAHSEDPAAAQKGVEAMLSGQNPEANRLASGLMSEILLDVPPEHRGSFVAIGRDLLTLARREQARAATSASPGNSLEGAVRARKELHAMGLRYWDEKQYLEAVKRGDAIAADLFVAAQGLPQANPAKNPPPAR